MDHFVYLFTFTTNDMLIVLISQSALSLTIQHRWSKPLWILRNRRNISISIIVWENIQKKMKECELGFREVSKPIYDNLGGF